MIAFLILRKSPYFILPNICPVYASQEVDEYVLQGYEAVSGNKLLLTLGVPRAVHSQTSLEHPT